MAEKIQLSIEISPEGEVLIKTSGLRGTDCTDETESLEQAVGEVTERKKTSEFYEHQNRGVEKQKHGR